MMTKLNTSTAVKSTKSATIYQLPSRPRPTTKGHFTLILPWALVLLALAWGTYESVQLLTGVIPKF